MNSFEKKLWLAKSKLLFLLTPKENRVRLEIAVDGRQLTYLLVSLQALGYALHVVESPMLFRELLCLKTSTPIPFIFGGAERACDLVISDRYEVVERATKQGVRAILLDSDFFSEGRTESRMPYFMHPSVYHAGLHRLPTPPIEKERPVRIGFFGTRDATFYTENFHFPMMNREQILSYFLGEFGEKILEGCPPVSSWERQNIVTVVDERGGDRDRQAKTFLPQKEYLNALRACDFFLSPPGVSMPLSHNLVEGMASGSIPILNSWEYLDPHLTHGVNCLTFTDEAGLKRVVEEALAMDAEKIRSMRRAVREYYDEYLTPAKWLGRFLSKHSQGGATLLVNAEEVSVVIDKESMLHNDLKSS